MEEQKKKFHLVLYINLGVPGIDVSLEMAEKYLELGADALQFDLPSRNPYRESQFIKNRMASAYQKYGSYKPFLKALTKFREKHQNFEMQMVSYEDVMMTIGTETYIDFCLRNNVRTCRIAGEGLVELARQDMNDAGIDTLTFIDYNMSEKDIKFALSTNRAVMLRNVRKGMEPRDGMVEWSDRIRYLRQRGIQSDIYATAGITSGKELEKAYKAGADGAFVGSCLMKLWNDPPAMTALLKELEQAAG